MELCPRFQTLDKAISLLQKSSAAYEKILSVAHPDRQISRNVLNAMKSIQRSATGNNRQAVSYDKGSRLLVPSPIYREYLIGKGIIQMRGTK
jgi:hypothetical protein